MIRNQTKISNINKRTRAFRFRTMMTTILLIVISSLASFSSSSFHPPDNLNNRLDGIPIGRNMSDDRERSFRPGTVAEAEIKISKDMSFKNESNIIMQRVQQNEKPIGAQIKLSRHKRWSLFSSIMSSPFMTAANQIQDGETMKKTHEDARINITSSSQDIEPEARAEARRFVSSGANEVSKHQEDDRILFDNHRDRRQARKKRRNERKFSTLHEYRVEDLRLEEIKDLSFLS